MSIMPLVTGNISPCGRYVDDMFINVLYFAIPCMLKLYTFMCVCNLCMVL